MVGLQRVEPPGRGDLDARARGMEPLADYPFHGVTAVPPGMSSSKPMRSPPTGVTIVGYTGLPVRRDDPDAGRGVLLAIAWAMSWRRCRTRSGYPIVP